MTLFEAGFAPKLTQQGSGCKKFTWEVIQGNMVRETLTMGVKEKQRVLPRGHRLCLAQN
jgi:hypothetical protein